MPVYGSDPVIGQMVANLVAALAVGLVILLVHHPRVVCIDEECLFNFRVNGLHTHRFIHFKVFIFEFLMAMDRLINAGVETWLYDNFEEITVIIHILIVSSCLKVGAIDLHGILERLISGLRRLSHSYNNSPIL